MSPASAIMEPSTDDWLNSLICIAPGLRERQAEMRSRWLAITAKEKEEDDRRQIEEKQREDRRRMQAFVDRGSDSHATMIILTSRMFNRDGRVWQYVDLDRGTIHWKKILRNYTFSGGQLRMLRIAASLFNREFKTNLWEDLGGLDDYNTTTVLKAISAFCRRYWRE
jgi:hypothetical protein